MRWQVQTKTTEKKKIQATTYLFLWCHISWSWNSQTYHSDISRCHKKDIVGGQEVPAEDLVGQSEVALEDGWHLGVKVFSAAELLQHLHGQHEDLTQAILLMVTNTWKIKQWLHFGIKYDKYSKKLLVGLIDIKIDNVTCWASLYTVDCCPKHWNRTQNKRS